MVGVPELGLNVKKIREIKKAKFPVKNKNRFLHLCLAFQSLDWMLKNPRNKKLNFPAKSKIRFLHLGVPELGLNVKKICEIKKLKFPAKNKNRFLHLWLAFQSLDWMLKNPRNKNQISRQKQNPVPAPVVGVPELGLNVKKIREIKNLNFPPKTKTGYHLWLAFQSLDWMLKNPRNKKLNFPAKKKPVPAPVVGVPELWLNIKNPRNKKQNFPQKIKPVSPPVVGVPELGLNEELVPGDYPATEELL
jgi:hypothetical protein